MGVTVFLGRSGVYLQVVGVGWGLRCIDEVRESRGVGVSVSMAVGVGVGVGAGIDGA